MQTFSMLKMILAKILILLILSGCTTIKFCKEENVCTTYNSMLKDIGYIEVVWTDKKIKIVATDIESEKVIKEIAKGAAEALIP
jgi:hypothetical protein